MDSGLRPVAGPGMTKILAAPQNPIHRWSVGDSLGARVFMSSRTVLAIIGLLCLAAPARADLQFCNKTSYVLDLALALEENGAAATRGWFRVDPGACRSVLQGAITADKIYLHARALAAYGPSPLPQS